MTARLARTSKYMNHMLKNRMCDTVQLTDNTMANLRLLNKIAMAIHTGSDSFLGTHTLILAGFPSVKTLKAIKSMNALLGVPCLLPLVKTVVVLPKACQGAFDMQVEDAYAQALVESIAPVLPHTHTASYWLMGGSEMSLLVQPEIVDIDLRSTKYGKRHPALSTAMHNMVKSWCCPLVTTSEEHWWDCRCKSPILKKVYMHSWGDWSQLDFNTSVQEVLMFDATEITRLDSYYGNNNLDKMVNVIGCHRKLTTISPVDQQVIVHGLRQEEQVDLQRILEHGSMPRAGWSIGRDDHPCPICHGNVTMTCSVEADVQVPDDVQELQVEWIS